MYAGGDFNGVEVVEQVLGKGIVVGDAFKTLFPAWERAELGFDFDLVELEGDFFGGFAVDVIVDAHLDFIEGVHDIGLGDKEVSNTVEHAGVAQSGDVNPSAAAGTAGGGAVLMSYLAEVVTCFVEEFGWEGTGTDACAVGFAYTHDTADIGGSHTKA